jgi:type III restriction enzyme
MSLQLREYQQRSLDALEEYLRRVTRLGADTAFYDVTRRQYRPVQQLPDLPYVCLRVPTGGGKTFMACYAVGIAARTFLHADRAVCLWLVPSNIIRDQTLTALRNRQHPYRQAVDSAFAGQVRAIDLSEALYLGRGDLEGATVLIVSTLQALRREDTEGLRVYRQSGNFQSIVADVPHALRGRLECYEHGEVIPSLANVFSLFRPLVIIDEAHNARTRLSFDTLARFQPSCIVEFTATPETTHSPDQGYFASNVLHHVSAAELKAEEMIKLPIKLKTRSEWKEVVGEALETQRKLEEAARNEERETGEYLRPIVLFQAQPRSQERQNLTVDVVKRTLIDDFKVPENRIAVATGETREIDDVDLFDRECPIRFIITVQALKEGWDCSFAYVLCSVAGIGSTRAFEQILGRILRLPRARWKKHAELNCLAGRGAGSSQGRSGGPGPGLHARTDCSAVVSVFHRATSVDSLCPT